MQRIFAKLSLVPAHTTHGVGRVLSSSGVALLLACSSGNTSPSSAAAGGSGTGGTHAAGTSVTGNTGTSGEAGAPAASDAGGTSAGQGSDTRTGSSGETSAGGNGASGDRDGRGGSGRGGDGAGTTFGIGGTSGGGATGGGAGGSSGGGDSSPTPVCVDDSTCSGATPKCDASAKQGLGACVQCLASADCAAATPACNPTVHGCADRFVGTWVYVGGTETETCDDGSAPSTLEPTGDVIIEPGATGHLQVDKSFVEGSDACIVDFLLSGDTATATPRSCNEPSPVGTRSMHFTSWSMQSTDGQTMTLSAAFSLGFSGIGSCGFVVNGTLTRVWPGATQGSGGSSGLGGGGGTGGTGGTGGSSGGGEGGATNVADLGTACAFDCPSDFPDCCPADSSWCYETGALTCDSGVCLGAGTGGYCSKACSTESDCAGGSVPMHCLRSCSAPFDTSQIVGYCWDATTYATVLAACD
jgi:hypothetical protein